MTLATCITADGRNPTTDISVSGLGQGELATGGKGNGGERRAGLRSPATLGGHNSVIVLDDL
jgi:hypothetical protein